MAASTLILLRNSAVKKQKSQPQPAQLALLSFSTFSPCKHPGAGRPAILSLQSVVADRKLSGWELVAFSLVEGVCQAVSCSGATFPTDLALALVFQILQAVNHVGRSQPGAGA